MARISSASFCSSQKSYFMADQIISETPDCLVRIRASPWWAASRAVRPKGSEIELITKISEIE